MRQKGLFGVLLLPSISSAALTIIITLAAFLTNFWEAYSNYPVVRDYVKSLRSLGDKIASEQTSSEAFGQVMSSPFVSRLLTIAFWALVGLLLYMLVFTIVFWTKDATSETTAASFAGKKPRLEALKSLTNRFVIRLLVLTVWIIYTVVFIQFIVPSSVGSIEIAASLGWMDNWLAVVTGVAMLLISIHLHVVFLRLLLLRPRVFNNAEDYMEG